MALLTDLPTSTLPPSFLIESSQAGQDIPARRHRVERIFETGCLAHGGSNAARRQRPGSSRGWRLYASAGGAGCP